MEKNLIKFTEKRKEPTTEELKERREDLAHFRQSLAQGNENEIKRLIRKYQNFPLITQEQLKIIASTKNSGYWKITEKSFYKTIYARQRHAGDMNSILSTHPKEATLIHVIAVEYLKKEKEEKITTASGKEATYIKFQLQQYEEYLRQARRQPELQEKRERQDSGMSI